MNSKVLRTFLGLSVVALSVPACIGLDSHRTSHNNTTVGQELQDLEVARDKNLITQNEYDRSRKRILDRY